VWRRSRRTGHITASSGSSGFKGNLVTLGNQSRIRKLIENAQTAIDSSPEQRMNLLEGANQFGLDDAGRGGNVVAVASRDTNDIVSATIEQCELINKITSAVGPETDGPTGGAILAYTRNPKRGAPPPPHQGATVTVTVTQSIIDAPNDGKAVFAMNFASRGTVIVNLTKNKIGGPLTSSAVCRARTRSLTRRPKSTRLEITIRRKR
jgi:hypothetical protein